VTTARLVLHQFRYDSRTFWRDPAAVFFTVALPIAFLFLFVSIFGNEPTVVDGHEIEGANYYLAGIMTLSLVSATLVNLAMTITGARERGILKRLRATPLPPWVFMAGRIGTASVITLTMMALLLGVGWIVYDVSVPARMLPAIVVTVLVGTAAFCAMALALTSVIPSMSAAPPITNAVVLPLYFVSGVFIPEEQLPDAMRALGDVFPIKHLFRAMLTAFDPTTRGSGFEPVHLLVLAAWGAVALVVATRTFRWVPTATSN
jgi:ABC-2 type transport system permease protein